MQDVGSATVKHTFRPRRTYVPHSKNLLKDQTNKKRIKETQQISSIRLQIIRCKFSHRHIDRVYQE